MALEERGSAGAGWGFWVAGRMKMVEVILGTDIIPAGMLLSMAR